jgi:hypothetical protein
MIPLLFRATGHAKIATLMRTLRSLSFMHVDKTNIPVWNKNKRYNEFPVWMSCIKLLSLIVWLFKNNRRREDLICNPYANSDIQLSECPVNIVVVQCRIDPKNSPVPLQEWNDGRFGESSADGVIGFERRVERGWKSHISLKDRSLFVQQTGCVTPNCFICKISEASARFTSSTPKDDAFSSKMYKVAHSATCIHQVYYCHHVA